MNRDIRPAAVHAERLTVRYGGPDRPEVLHGIDLTVAGGACTAIVGESGSGKTTLGRAIAGLLPETAVIGGTLTTATRASFIPQDSVNALNPLRTVAWQLEQVLRHRQVPRTQRRERSAAILRAAGVPDPDMLIQRYPHELSGGLAQRVVLATVLATDPELLIADEPTSALDVTTQAKVISLLRALVDDSGITLLIITHDLRAAARIADHVAVVYHGHLVEHGPTGQVLDAPAHEYTRALVATATSRPIVSTAAGTGSTPHGTP